MSQAQISPVFQFQSHPVRTIIENGQPWFVGRDIASLLGYAKPDKEIHRICKHAKLFKCTNLVPLRTPPRGLLIIPEPDVWRLVIQSTLPKAQKIEAWIMSEVLPAIRKTGKYEAAPKQAALPMREESNVVMYGTPRFWLKEIDKLWKDFDAFSLETQRTANAFSRQLGELVTNRLYKSVVNRIEPRRGLHCDYMIEGLHNPAWAFTEGVRSACLDFYFALSQARAYAEAMKD